MLDELAPASQIRVTIFNPAVRERLSEQAVSIVEGPDRRPWRGYYVDAAFRTVVQDGEKWIELGDGGLTTWTAQLMGNAKERCLVSCLSTERLAALGSR